MRVLPRVSRVLLRVQHSWVAQWKAKTVTWTYSSVRPTKKTEMLTQHLDQNSNTNNKPPGHCVSHQALRFNWSTLKRISLIKTQALIRVRIKSLAWDPKLREEFLITRSLTTRKLEPVSQFSRLLLIKKLRAYVLMSTLEGRIHLLRLKRWEETRIIVSIKTLMSKFLLHS